MSDHRERACTNCGSYLHHEDDCPKAKPMTDLNGHRLELVDCPEEASEIEFKPDDVRLIREALKVYLTCVATKEEEIKTVMLLVRLKTKP